jgi:catechol 2,3-dioxygenase-like lactoylglutathione lyase family enzyme
MIAFVPTTDLTRAIDFYSKTIGLRLESQTPQAGVFRAGNTMLRVSAVPELTPPPFSVLGWGVPDICAAVRELAERGVAFTRYAEMDQDELGIWTAPGGDRVAWFTDPDGNTLSLTQFAADGGSPPDE